MVMDASSRFKPILGLLAWMVAVFTAAGVGAAASVQVVSRIFRTFIEGWSLA